MKNLILGMIIYTIVIFAITAFWHVGLFKELYTNLGYFNEKETAAAAMVGLLNILVQGVVLAVLYTHSHFAGSRYARGLKFAGLIGVFYFTTQVVNFVVRKEVSDISTFVFLEAVYIAIEFVIYGLMMGAFVKSGRSA